MKHQPTLLTRAGYNGAGYHHSYCQSWYIGNIGTCEGKSQFKTEVANNADCFTKTSDQCAASGCVWMTKDPVPKSGFDRCSKWGCIPPNVTNVWHDFEGYSWGVPYGCVNKPGKLPPNAEGVFWANCYRKNADGTANKSKRLTSAAGLEKCQNECTSRFGDNTICELDTAIVKVANFNGDVAENWSCVNKDHTLQKVNGDWVCQ